MVLKMVMTFQHNNMFLSIDENKYNLEINMGREVYVFYYEKEKSLELYIKKSDLLEYKHKANDTVEQSLKKIDIIYNNIVLDPSRIIYYTGAGISRKSGIITLPELFERFLFYDSSLLIEQIKKEPKYLLDLFNEFLFSFRKAKPNENHYLLRKIIKNYGGMLITEI